MELDFIEQDFERAWLLFQERFAMLADKGIAKRHAGAIAVVDGRKIPTDRGDKLREAVVWERSINPETWDEDATYDVNARTKAMMSARDRQRSRLTIRDGGSLQIGDFAWPGGVYLNRFGFGFSGVQPEVDELLAADFMNLTRLMARRRVDAASPPEPPNEAYVGGKPHKSLGNEAS